MPATILSTKLFIPPPRAEAVLRSRLTGRMDEGRKLTLVCAPAGSGKTTLLGEWAAALGERPVAWLSLDEGDNDPARFLAHFVAALRTVEAGIGDGVMAALQSPQPTSAEAILTALLNEVSAAGRDLILVLDDFHVVDSEAVDDALSFVVERMPARMRLVISTREDPNLPLARLRARNDLTELRAADLRFTLPEAAEFLNEAMGLDLSEGDVAALEERTEGWVSGLQLAAISMKGRGDASAFIESFTGSHRFVLDFLVEEVLHRQPENVRSFLFQTSILDRMCGPLCDAVTGREDGRGMLDALDRGNLFVIPLDDEREWYRYHHLFADVLQARSWEERPERTPALHRRASEWHEHNGLRSDAIRHALAAGDVGRAANLVELSARALLTERREETFIGWTAELPEAAIRARPVLGVYYALALVSTDLDAAAIRLREAERSLDAAATRPESMSVGMEVVDEKEFRVLPGIISIIRAYHAGAMGDVSGSVEHARRAWDLCPEDDLFWRGGAAALLGLGCWASGDLEEAYRFFTDGTESLWTVGAITQSNSGVHILAGIRTAQGRLRDAERIYGRALKLAESRGGAIPPGTLDLHVGMGELLCERGDLEGAVRHLRRSEELGESGGIAENRHRWHVAMSRIKEAEGEPSLALDLLDEAESLYVPSPDPDVRPISALRARVWIRHGSLAEAADWARERNLSPDNDLAYLREFEHITLARMLLARHIPEAMEFLDRLLEAADGAGRMGSVIEILALRALACQARGDTPTALSELERALALAEPEGYVRIFADEGEPMARLLTETAERGTKPDYARKLLTFFDSGEDEAHPSLAEPLSGRELEVLRLVSRGHSNREICEKLFLALVTVKGHNRNIFRKLGVRRRTEAVARARELGLL